MHIDQIGNAHKAPFANTGEPNTFEKTNIIGVTRSKYAEAIDKLTAYTTSSKYLIDE